MKKTLLLTLACILFISFSAVSQCGQISLTGESSTFTEDRYMDRNPNDPDIFTTIITLTAADDISTPPDSIAHMFFRENGNADVQWGSADFPSGIAILGGDSIPVLLGSYIVSFNCSTLEYSFTEICGQIGIVGEFTAWENDCWMLREKDDPDQWSMLLTLMPTDDINNDNIIELKFRQNGAWMFNWGDSEFPDGVAFQDGPNIPVPLDNTGLTTDYLVTFNCATGDYHFESTCGQIGLIGEFTLWAEDHFLEREGGDPDQWTTIISLTAEDDSNGDDIIEMKFRENSDWATNWGDDEFPSGTGEQDGPDIPVPLYYIGLTTDYLVTFNGETFEYSFESVNGDISIIGAFNGWAGDAMLNRSSADPHSWELTRSWFADSEVKFRENSDWTINWGSSEWPSGTGEQDGPNIPLEEGTYDISFNSSTGEYDFTDNPDVCGEIGLVGDFNNWGDDGSGIPTDVFLSRDPEALNSYSIDYFFQDATALLFRENADLSFQDIWGGDFPDGEWPCKTGVSGYDADTIQVPGGLYSITFNCLSGDYCFTREQNSVSSTKVISMEVDGILEETYWDISQPINQLADGTVNYPPSDILFGTTYNDDYLFIGIEVDDDELTDDDFGDVFIDGDMSLGDYDDADLHIAYSSDGFEVIHGPYGIAILFTMVTSGDWYAVEIGIPLADLGISPEEGDEIGFDIMISDADYGEPGYLFSWNGGLANYESTSMFGRLIFGPLDCGCISLYNESIGDIVLHNQSELPTKYVSTYEMYTDHDVKFRQDNEDIVSWGGESFPSGTAVLGGEAIPATTGRYRISFDCSSGEYNFEEKPVDEGVAYSIYSFNPPLVDGNLEEYQLLYTSDILVLGNGLTYNEVSWGSAWDGSNLYIGASVIDEVVEGTEVPWESDGIEFYIDGNHDEDGPYDSDFDTQLILDAVNGSWLWIRNDGVPITDYEAMWVITPEGYNVELRVAWWHFDFDPAVGTSIGWSLSNNDSDWSNGRDYQTTWYGTENNWNNTADLGDLQLVNEYVVGNEEIVDNSLLLVVYPNPFSDVTQVNISIIKKGTTVLEVFTISGTKIRELMNEEMLPGTHEVEVDLRDLPAGIYYCVLRTMNETITTKLIKL